MQYDAHARPWQIVSEAGGAVVPRKRLIVVTDLALYIIVHRVNPQLGPGTRLANHYGLCRRVALGDILAVDLSTMADDLIIVHLRDRAPTLPRAPWVGDQTVEACPACKRRFWTAVRRHHCRQCGNVFCSACCPADVLPLPDRELYTPVRLCVNCIGLDASDLWQDYALQLPHRTEFLAVLADVYRARQAAGAAQQLDVRFSDDVELSTLQPDASGKSGATTLVKAKVRFIKDSTYADGCVRIVSGGPAIVRVRVADGIPAEIVERILKEDARRRKAKQQRQAQQPEELRKQTDPAKAKKKSHKPATAPSSTGARYGAAAQRTGPCPADVARLAALVPVRIPRPAAMPMRQQPQRHRIPRRRRSRQPVTRRHRPASQPAKASVVSTRTAPRPMVSPRRRVRRGRERFRSDPWRQRRPLSYRARRCPIPYDRRDRG